MEFISEYSAYIGEFITWLSKPEASVPALRLVQATAAILGATISVLGFYRAWRYAESRLGLRLNEFLDKEEKNLVIAREVCRAVRDERSTTNLSHSNLFTSGELKSALKHMGRRRYGAAKAELSGALARTKERADLARSKGDLHHRQTAMAYLLLGAIADQEGDHQSALIHFLSALNIDETDIEALEYVGIQYLKLGNGNQALETFLKLKERVDATGDALVKSRAFRNCGRAYEALPEPLYLNANIFYRDAINAFPPNGPAIELAELHELRAGANIQHARYPLARTSLMSALTGYSALHYGGGKQAKLARDGMGRVLAAIRDLDERQNSNASTANNPSASSAPIEATSLT
ncbi:MAG: tetratricopeptide repeat protein [Hyphomicrobiaceae bacterium]